MSLLRNTFAAAAALVMAATLSSTAQAAPAAEEWTSTVRTAGDVSAQARTAWVNNNTGKCLSVRAADNRNGAPVFQFDCTPEWTDQRWVVYR